MIKMNKTQNAQNDFIYKFKNKVFCTRKKWKAGIKIKCNPKKCQYLNECKLYKK